MRKGALATWRSNRALSSVTGRGPEPRDMVPALGAGHPGGRPLTL